MSDHGQLILDMDKKSRAILNYHYVYQSVTSHPGGRVFALLSREYDKRHSATLAWGSASLKIGYLENKMLMKHRPKQSLV